MDPSPSPIDNARLGPSKPSFQSQETEDPALSLDEPVCAKQPKPSFQSQETQDPSKEADIQASPSFESQETLDATFPPEVPVEQEAETLALLPVGEQSRVDVTNDDEKLPKEKKDAGFYNPYAAPWQSNLASRRFDRELEVATVQANQARNGPVRTAGPDPQQWYTATSRAAKKPAEKSDIWNDSEPQGPYHEVVRGKARKDLPTHDCPECTAFYNTLIVDSQSMDIRQYCRHRSRYGPPPETPEDFWELDFADELKERRKADAEAALAAAKRKLG